MFHERQYEKNYRGELIDILEDPEEAQYFDRSSSMNSQNIRKFLSNDEIKFGSDLTNQYSKEGESANASNFSKVIKSGKIMKKGLIFYNERVMSLTSTPRLYYISGEVEKEIDLNMTTVVRQMGEKAFEITNYYPTTTIKFKTHTSAECEEWVVLIQKSIQNVCSE
jgi:hypothetical protein